ncbi:hypothetical protein ABK040_014090 [Willaertia magna]
MLNTDDLESLKSGSTKSSISSLSSLDSYPNQNIFSNNDEDKSSVRVVVRVRPLLESEHQSCIMVDQQSKRTLQIRPNSKEKPKLFTFDFVASPQSTQKEMFEYCGKPIVDSCLAGYNGTVFCYGQTSSGKTFTMGTTFNDVEEDHFFHLPPSAGLIPRVIYYLFHEMERKKQETNIKFVCKCSFLEIYNEKISDLLDDNISTTISTFSGNTITKSLNLREDIKNGVYVEDLSQEDILTPKEALDLLRKGVANRHIAATAANPESSRSHSVFTILIQSQEVSESGVQKTRTSRLNLIDLAGSERQSSTNAEGDRLKEACMINKSLSTLGKVIKDLVDVANGIQRHVQYRDSKLTYLLKDSLGGNSKTCIIANVSPALQSSSETVSTLKFAQRAKKIKNEAKINEETFGSVPVLQEQIRILRRQLNEANRKLMEKDFQPNNQNIEVIPNNGQTITLQESDEKEQYIQELHKQHLFVASQFDEEEEKSAKLREQMKSLYSAIDAKEYLLRCTRFFLKIRECRIARLQQKSPKFAFDKEISPIKNSRGNGDAMHDEEFFTPVSGQDFDFEKHQKEFDVNYDEFSLENEEQWLSKAEALFQKALSPEQHPDVITLKIENMELKQQLEDYESQFGDEYIRSKNNYSKLKEYTSSLEKTIKHLTADKEKLLAKCKGLETDNNRRASILLQSTVSNTKENEQLLEEITSLELKNEELQETVATLKKELEVLQESEQNAWQQVESAKQLVDEIAEEKESFARLFKESEEQRKEVLQIIDDIENQQATQRQKEEELIVKEELMKEKEVSYLKQLEDTQQQLETLVFRESELTEILRNKQLAEEASINENDQLKQHLNNKNNELDVLMNNFREKETQFSNLLKQKDTEIENLKRSVDELSRVVEDLKVKGQELIHEKQNELEDTASNLSSQITQLSNQVNDYKNSIEERDRTIESLNTKYNNEIQEHESTRKILCTLQEELNTFKSKEQNLLTSLQSKEYSLEELQKEHVETKQRLSVTEQQISEKNNDFIQQQIDLEQKIEELNQEVQFMKSKEKDLTDDLEHKTKACDELTKLKEQIETQLKEKEILWQEKEDDYQKLVEEMNFQLKESKSKVDELSSLIEEQQSTMERKIESQILHIEKLKGEMEEKENELKNLFTLYETANNSLQDSNQRIEELEHSLLKEKSFSKTKENEVEQLKKQLDKFELENENLFNDLRNATIKVDELNNELNNVQKEYSQFKSNHEDTLNRLKKKAADEQQRNDELMQVINSMGSSGEEEKQQLIERENKYKEQTATEIASLKEDVEVLTLKLEETLQDNETLVGGIEELKQKHASELQETNQLKEALENELSKANESITSLKEEIQSLHKKLNEAISNEEVANKIKEAELENLSNEINKLKELLTLSNSKCNDLELAIDSQKETYSKLESRLNDEKKDFNLEKEKLNSFLIEKDKTLNKVTKEKSDLMEELNLIKLSLNAKDTEILELTELAEESISKLKIAEDEILEKDNKIGSLGELHESAIKNIQTLTAEIEEYKKNGTVLSEENSTLKAQLCEIKDELLKKTEEIEKQKSTIQKLSSGEEVLKFKQEMTVLDKKVERLENELQSERDLLFTKENQLNSLRLEQDQNKQKISDLEKELLSQQIASEENVQKLKEEYEQKETELNSAIEKLKLELKESETDVTQLREEVESLRKDNEKLIGHNNHKQKIQYQMKIKQENNDLKEELHKIQKLLLEKETYIKKLKTQVDVEKLVSPTNPVAPNPFASTKPVQPIGPIGPNPFSSSTNTSLLGSPLKDKTRVSVYSRRQSMGGRKLLDANTNTNQQPKPVKNKPTNLTLPNTTVDKENQPEDLQTPLSAQVLFGNNRKRRNNPVATTTTTTETKKVKPTENVPSNTNNTNNNSTIFSNTTSGEEPNERRMSFRLR